MPRSPRRAAGPAPSPEPVRLSAVGFGYAERPDVLRDVNLILPRGSFHFLTGASGAGKSSLLKLLTLAVPPTSGEVVLFGDDVSRISPRSRPTYRRRMGVVFQDFRLLDHLTTYENVALPLRVQGREEVRYRAEVIELLGWVVTTVQGSTRIRLTDLERVSGLDPKLFATPFPAARPTGRS
jgi:cell division transport system ATP-binding protein